MRDNRLTLVKRDLGINQAAKALEHHKLLLEKGVMLEESPLGTGLLAADAGEFEWRRVAWTRSGGLAS